MSTTIRFQLSQSQAAAASAAAGKAQSFLEGASFPLGTAMIDHAWSNGSAIAVIEQLAAYQNDDGGFGHGIEVDIKSPASNPFAARLAMHILLELHDRPVSDLERSLQQWLIDNQHEDGDWHFSEETKAGELAPWFAAWTFPGLNPACCIAGLANQLGIATPAMLERTAKLFAAKASIEEAKTGEYYNVLPYSEYSGGVDWADRDEYLAAIAVNIEATARAGNYADAGHFWEHALGGGPDLIRRLPVDLLSRFADQIVAEQAADGGWPTPYDPNWRPLITAQSAVTSSRLRHGV